LEIEFEEARETYIKIIRRPDRSLVAVLELLSPTNKTDIGYADYLSKRRSLLWQDVHLVELDLLIGGTRIRTSDPLPAGHYYAIVARSDRRPNAEVYAWTIRDRLSTIQVPLKPPDPDVQIDLQPVFDTTFDRGRYAPVLRYGSPPLVPVSDDDLKRCAGLAKTMTAEV